jgi:signal transduction histidine kinase
MRERSQKIGAQLNIWSNSGAGTEIDLFIPAKVAYRHPHKKSGWNEFKRRVARQSE